MWAQSASYRYRFLFAHIINTDIISEKSNILHNWNWNWKRNEESHMLKIITNNVYTFSLKHMNKIN